jgi:hypothetical protein
MTISSPNQDQLLRGPTRTIGGGRLGIYAALGAVAGSVPLPWIPDSIAKRVRGALVHDIAARHGISLANDARDVLADPDGDEASRPRTLIRQAARFFGTKLLARFGPIGVLPPVRSALSVFVLGYLFDRYLEQSRSERTVRIDADEARHVRHAIDRALTHAVTAEGEHERVASAPEELRDQATQVFDTLLMAAAGVPGWLMRRLDAAFDELLPPARR